MIITSVTPFVLRIPVRKPLDSEAREKGLPGVRIETDEGLVGTGFTGHHSRGVELFARAIEGVYSEVLCGEDPTEVRRLWDRLRHSKMFGLGRAGVVSRAHAAIDIALWDLTAQAIERPLWRMLGAHKTEGLETYMTVGSLDWPLDRLLSAVETLMDRGWRAFKVKVGHSRVSEDLRRIEALRDRFGGSFDLMVDANKKWDVAQAIAFARGADGYDLRWLEEPCNPEDVRGHARLARTSAIPVALGESLHSKQDFLNFIQADAVHYLQADAAQLAGITEWLSVAGLADCHGLPIVPHHSDFAQAQQHLVAATSSAIMIEFPWETDIFVDPVRVKENRIVLPETPGASTAIEPAAFERYRVY